ncbi:MliC family protein [Azoarcus sp. DN11]|uniref:MliC family protein n=1 Tax=Azoarcus sp. DN11 TaxID=356837 RepID=UPI000EB33B10|nr:MliC family protein [Azoarcus sp. DN11]AYH44178.1 hypothetical protein CDA09_12410 [Azoarcus sp. DN11]
MHLNRQFAALSALLIGAISLAGTAWTRDGSHVVSYACAGGEQFTVEYFDAHVRLRTGAGVFALAGKQVSSGERYTDGYTVFTVNGNRAMLERPGLPESTCSPMPRPSL